MAFTPKQEKVIDDLLAVSELADIYMALAKFTMAHNPETDPVAFELLTTLADIGEKYIRLEKQKPADTLASIESELAAMEAEANGLKEDGFRVHTHKGIKFYVNPLDVVGSYERTFGTKLTEKEKEDFTKNIAVGLEAIKAGVPIETASKLFSRAAQAASPGLTDKAEAFLKDQGLI